MSNKTQKIAAKIDTLKCKVKELEGQKQALQQAERARQSQLKRKAENRLKFRAGGLVKIAGLIDCDPAELLGGLIAVSKANHETKQRWRVEGASILSARSKNGDQNGKSN